MCYVPFTVTALSFIFNEPVKLTTKKTSMYINQRAKSSVTKTLHSSRQKDSTHITRQHMENADRLQEAVITYCK